MRSIVLGWLSVGIGQIGPPAPMYCFWLVAAAAIKQCFGGRACSATAWPIWLQSSMLLLAQCLSYAIVTFRYDQGWLTRLY